MVQEWAAAVVLIPSFSGLWLVKEISPYSAVAFSLNPFFFRSLVGPGALARLPRGIRLNPFFFRSLVGQDGSLIVTRNGSLNPFFFRSLVGLDTCGPLGTVMS